MALWVSQPLFDFEIIAWVIIRWFWTEDYLTMLYRALDAFVLTTLLKSPKMDTDDNNHRHSTC